MLLTLLAGIIGFYVAGLWGSIIAILFTWVIVGTLLSPRK